MVTSSASMHHCTPVHGNVRVPCGCRYGHSYTIELRVRPEAGLLDLTEADLADLGTPLDVAIGGPDGASALDATQRWAWAWGVGLAGTEHRVHPD